MRRAVHNAGCLPIEAAVTYPFHPFASQIVLIVGHIEHAGSRHLIVRKPDGSAFLLPAWMTAPEAGLIRTVTYPRLPVNRVIELRAPVDRLMASSSGELVPTGGQGHEEIEVTAAESVRANATLRRSTVASSFEGNRAAQGAVDGSDARNRRDRRPNKRGSWR
jgi:hypothetical protein